MYPSTQQHMFTARTAVIAIITVILTLLVFGAAYLALDYVYWYTSY